jgi:hypothetical protein
MFYLRIPRTAPVKYRAGSSWPVSGELKTVKGTSQHIAVSYDSPMAEGRVEERY